MKLSEGDKGRLGTEAGREFTDGSAKRPSLDKHEPRSLQQRKAKDPEAYDTIDRGRPLDQTWRAGTSSLNFRSVRSIKPTSRQTQCLPAA